ncbi:hypothetical protein [Kocuria marina]|uniref:hypothetical protein n=1 Tax=Kocuria marina TaxID=223184 RepID=UPI0015CF11C3|nr:hypothetical protein [Kocuria indica]MBN6811484.1 hypothetical protein [Kocuria indica]MBN6843178.1 hypothetical protein [Kocuria indica]
MASTVGSSGRQSSGNALSDPLGDPLCGVVGDAGEASGAGDVGCAVVPVEVAPVGAAL